MLYFAILFLLKNTSSRSAEARGAFGGAAKDREGKDAMNAQPQSQGKLPVPPRMPPAERVAPMLIPLEASALEPYVDTQQVLPTQFFTGDRHALEQPELRLMQAMLVDAYRCFTLYATSQVPEEKQWHRDAVEWFFGIPAEGDHLFSFENVCEQLDVCPERIRAVVRAFRPDPNAPVRQPRKRVRRRRQATNLDAASQTTH